MKHFLEENNFTKEEIESVFQQAFKFKRERDQRPSTDLLGQTWGMLFYKNSTRTRVSFEVGKWEDTHSCLIYPIPNW